MLFSNHIIYRNNEVPWSYELQNVEIMEISLGFIIAKKELLLGASTLQ